MSEPKILYRDDKIRAVLAARKMTGQDLADAAGVGRGSIHLICKGQPDVKLSTLKKIADALEMSLQELVEPREQAA